MWGKHPALAKGFVAAAAAVLISTSIASAQSQSPSMTVKSLYEDCKANDQNARIACIMYLRGVADFADVMGSGFEKNKKVKPEWAAEDQHFAICGANWTGAALRETFIAYVDSNPSVADQSPFYGAIRALKDRWPCK